MPVHSQIVSAVWRDAEDLGLNLLRFLIQMLPSAHSPEKKNLLTRSPGGGSHHAKDGAMRPCGYLLLCNTTKHKQKAAKRYFVAETKVIYQTCSYALHQCTGKRKFR